ncbi:hypothetical protein N7454_009484 [Penicillium verhagenii]|nr:hypothetical protein N7454_009484 [Penicillium verhagenii]
MSLVDTFHFDIYVAVCYSEPGWPGHWMVFLRHPGADRCAYRFHSLQNDVDFQLAIEYNTRFDSRSIKQTFYLGRIPTSAICTVEREAHAVPPQSCQCWVLYFLLRLQWKRLVPLGTYEHWRDNHVESHRVDRGPGMGQ